MKFKFFKMTCPPHPFTPYWLPVPWPICWPHSGGTLLMLKQASFPSSCLRGSSVPDPVELFPRAPQRERTLPL
ncbi:hypothetical protein H8957_013462, partial [Semnopithecus entellus]